MVLTLTYGEPTTFTNSGPEVTFTAEGTTTPINDITSADVSKLTTQAASVYVALAIDGTDGTDCLKSNGDYNSGSDASLCTDQLWYFILRKFWILGDLSFRIVDVVTLWLNTHYARLWHAMKCKQEPIKFRLWFLINGGA